MFNLLVRYPSVDEEVDIIKNTTSTCEAAASKVLSSEEVVRLQGLVRGVPIADDVIRFAARLVAATRPGEVAGHDRIHHYLSYGASPRASQFLVLGAKARAIMAGRYHVDFDDIRALAPLVLRHRLIVNFHARAENIDSDVLVERLLDVVKNES